MLEGMKLIIDIGDNREVKPFAPDGQAIVPDVPVSMVDKSVPVWLSNGQIRLKDTQLRILPYRVAAGSTSSR
jgi:hypothetical protein